jgi:hypothetical protein
MPWARLMIPEAAVPFVSPALVAAFSRAYQAAGRPPKVALYREYLLGGDRVFWFTAEAAEAMPELLKEYGAEEGEAPDVATLKYISM